MTNVESMRANAEKNGMRGIYPTRALGLIAALKWNPSKRLSDLMRRKRVVVLFDVRKKKKEVRARDVVVLVNFLYEVLWWYWNANSAGPVQLITED